MPLRIIYLTGASACGKGTLGKRLAADFGLYHISLGDVRRAHLDAINNGVPLLRNNAICEYVKQDKVIPPNLLARYDVVPAVLLYHNHRASRHRGWTAQLAAAMMAEELSRIQEATESSGNSNAGVIVDGHPLTGGVISEEVVLMNMGQFAGLTIVIESPRETARQRFVERSRQITDNNERFETRMELTDRALPKFITLMAGFGEIVRSRNDESMTIDDAYNALLLALDRSRAWQLLIRETASGY
ncbi:putative uridine kinase [Rosellinia necatrix]|uniref:Putative uridine kinase n=1 Tax=Rosellinia necatrix TaxID=77044 RepID=A0A1W2TRL9_ROSNE|nr:putative uridine kinase [Rosellinia necatrix]